MFDLRTSTGAFGKAVAQQQMATTVALVFALVGLLLAAVGTYGVVAYTVSRGLRDFGVRLALGASRGSVLGAVLLRGGRLIVVGVGLGLMATVGLPNRLPKRNYRCVDADPGRRFPSPAFPTG